MTTLAIVACGSKKIWKLNNQAGPTPAKETYIGTLFKLSRAYAERFVDSWVVLSAKHGFAEPGFLIPANYDTTFNRKSTNPVQLDTLRVQVKQMHLDRFDHVIVLGGARYVRMVEASFEASSARVEAPLKGLGIGQMQSKLKQSIRSGTALGHSTSLAPDKTRA